MAGSAESLRGVRIVSTAINLPGPVAVARLCSLGATALKVEPPSGDPLASACPPWYEELHKDVKVSAVDLKNKINLKNFESILSESDLLITSNRLDALDRLGLGWTKLSSQFPHLLQVAIIGHPRPDHQIPGHDLTYQAALGLVEPPRLPRTLLADLAGAERVVSEALNLILAIKRQQGSQASDEEQFSEDQPASAESKSASSKFAENKSAASESASSKSAASRFAVSKSTEGRFATVSLAEAAAPFALPYKYGLTGHGGLLGGSLPGYNIYETREGWVAIAALEPHFMRQLAEEFSLADLTRDCLADLFRQKSAHDWQAWAHENSFPLVEVKDLLSPP